MGGGCGGAPVVRLAAATDRLPEEAQAMGVRPTLVAAALAGLTMMLLSGTAAADVIKVSPGDSIQAAINKAEQGDTVKVAPGTYQENVQIKTDGIKLKGAGADETVLEP